MYIISYGLTMGRGKGKKKKWYGLKSVVGKYIVSDWTLKWSWWKGEGIAHTL